MSRYRQKKTTQYSPVLIGVVIVLIALVIWWFLNKTDKSGVITQPVEIPQEKKLHDFDGEKLLINESKNNNTGKSLDENLSTAKENNAKLLKTKPKLVGLKNSDESFREAVTDVSENFGDWFEVKDSITKYITLIHDISQNQILTKNRAFLHAPKKNGIAKKDSQGLYLTEEGYKRYDHFANAVASINTQKGLDLYLTFKPLFNKVYNNFSYPKAYKVEDIFLKAAANVIKAPVVEGRIALVKHSIFYKFSDKNLEALGDVEKQMLRMGPKNTKKIQAKLRQLVEVISELNE